MPASKFTELPAASALTGAEIIAAVQGGVSKRATVQEVADFGSWGRFSPAIPPTATHTGNVAETTIATVTIPGGTVRAGTMIDIVYGTYSDSAALNDSLALYIDGNAVRQLIVIQADGGPKNYIAEQFMVFAKTTGLLVSVSTGEIAVDFTADVDVEFRVTLGAGANTAGLWAYGVRVTGAS